MRIKTDTPVYNLTLRQIWFLYGRGTKIKWRHDRLVYTIERLTDQRCYVESYGTLQNFCGLDVDDFAVVEYTI